MIKWKKSTKSILMNGVQTPTTFFEVYKWNGEFLFSCRCSTSHISQISRILTDIVYCDDYIEYFPLLNYPTAQDKRILELSLKVKQEAIY